jgi:hypothetical protein
MYCIVCTETCHSRVLLRLLRSEKASHFHCAKVNGLVGPCSCRQEIQELRPGLYSLSRGLCVRLLVALFMLAEPLAVAESSARTLHLHSVPRVLPCGEFPGVLRQPGQRQVLCLVLMLKSQCPSPQLPPTTGNTAEAFSVSLLPSAPPGSRGMCDQEAEVTGGILAATLLCIQHKSTHDCFWLA